MEVVATVACRRQPKLPVEFRLPVFNRAIVESEVTGKAPQIEALPRTSDGLAWVSDHRGENPPYVADIHAASVTSATTSCRRDEGERNLFPTTETH